MISDISDLSDAAALEALTSARARGELAYLRAHAASTRFRERVLQFLFRRHASWNVGENGSFMNRTSFRACCRELELVDVGRGIGGIGGIRGRFVTGDIEVCFADGLLSVPDGAGQGNMAGQSLGRSPRGQTKRRPLLNYRQFVMAVQGIAIKLFGRTRYQHLDPRYIAVRVQNNSARSSNGNDDPDHLGGPGKVRHPFEDLYMGVLLPKALQFGLGMDADVAGPGSHSPRTGGLSTSPLAEANAAVAGSPQGALQLAPMSPSTSGGRQEAVAAAAAAAARRLSPEMQAARRVLRVERKAIEGIFNAFAVTESGNNTGALTTSGLSFNEFSYMARECDLIPRYLSLSQLLVVFRRHRKLYAGDFDLDYAGIGAQVPAHMELDGFENALCTVALKYVHRTCHELKPKSTFDEKSDDGALSFEDPREKVLALVKTIANSRGIRQMALRPRRAATVRFVSRMNGFR
jgi:hypothetical protein